jgi:hypothetical protein
MRRKWHFIVSCFIPHPFKGEGAKETRTISPTLPLKEGATGSENHIAPLSLEREGDLLLFTRASIQMDTDYAPGVSP